MEQFLSMTLLNPVFWIIYFGIGAMISMTSVGYTVSRREPLSTTLIVALVTFLAWFPAIFLVGFYGVGVDMAEKVEKERGR
jgi:hypothetical protein